MLILHVGLGIFLLLLRNLTFFMVGFLCFESFRPVGQKWNTNLARLEKRSNSLKFIHLLFSSFHTTDEWFPKKIHPFSIDKTSSQSLFSFAPAFTPQMQSLQVTFHNNKKLNVYSSLNTMLTQQTCTTWRHHFVLNTSCITPSTEGAKIFFWKVIFHCFHSIFQTVFSISSKCIFFMNFHKFSKSNWSRFAQHLHQITARLYISLPSTESAK